jgi:hypothetical protein
MFFGAANFFYAQKPSVKNKVDDLASMRLENVQLEAQSIESLFSDLSLSYDIPIGLETASHDDEIAFYSIEFKNGTLSDLLTQFVVRHNQYVWEIKNGVVNIFPKDKYRDIVLDKLLEAKISNLLIKEKTSCWALEESLVNTTEIKKILEANEMTRVRGNFSGAYIPQLGRHFTLEISNMTLKSILNKVIKESAIAKFWIIKTYSSEQTFILRLNARHEDTPVVLQRLF